MTAHHLTRNPRRVPDLLRTCSALLLGGLLACSADVPPGAPAATDDWQDLPEAQAQPLSAEARAGQKLFETPFPGTNGRSCATCHVMTEATTLLPASVAARLAADPTEPLFRRIDADDPQAAEPDYEHLKKGLVRVVLPLPDNMDVIDLEGKVVTPADRTIFVWRGVPSVANVSVTAPYQLDGRAHSLGQQAQGAITTHSEGPLVESPELERIAEFQRTVFSSSRARFVSAMIGLGVPLDDIPMPEDNMALDPQGQRGRKLFDRACLACHGSATTDRVVNREVHKLFFTSIKPDGNIRFQVIPGVGPVPVFVDRPNVEIFNYGFGIFTYLGQLGLFPTFNASVSLPRYRFRFYEDGTRSKAVTELPPVPVTASGDPFDPTSVLDENGAPIVGPNLLPQAFTTDPGRAVITGDPADFEAFDVPQLRGIAHTPPYFHDNSHETLGDVVDSYSRFVLPALPPLEMPAVHPPEIPGFPPEALSPAEKQDLLSFLNRL
jgi:cytochrome c peroxidase